MANTIVICFRFHSTLFDQLSERVQRWHLCHWFLGSASLAFRFSAGVVLETWVAPLQSRSCSVISFRPLATEVHLRIFHRWIGSFVPTSWLLVVLLLNDLWRRNLKRRTRYPTTYSTGLLICHLQLMLMWLQELLLASLAGVHLTPNQALIFLPMTQFCLPTSWTQKGDECRNNLFQESLEPRLDCSSGLASSSNLGSGLSTLAAPQSVHPISVVRVRGIALLSMVETSHALKQLSALFQSWHLLSHGSLLLIRTLFRLGVEV